MSKHIHLIGFGSQGTAWGENLRDSGWAVNVYLARTSGSSFEKASQSGFQPKLLEELPAALEKDPSSCALIGILTPDHLIGSIYGDVIARTSRPLVVVLAHGYAVYAKELAASSPEHSLALLAPKAIGPKLRASFNAAYPRTHGLVAGFFSSDFNPERSSLLNELALGLGFAPGNLVPATFEQEAIGDLISEQALLCGGLFNLLEWTMSAMRTAGVPEKLIAEECLTELELIAGLIRERGPAATFAAISQAAQCGTVSMAARFEQAKLKELIQKQADDVVSRRFVDVMRDEANWKPKAAAFKERLMRWGREFK